MINSIIKGNKNRALLVLLVSFLISGWFYWFQYRPAQIRSNCHIQSSDEAMIVVDSKPDLISKYFPSAKKPEIEISSKDYEFFYNSCLHEKGLK